MRKNGRSIGEHDGTVVAYFAVLSLYVFKAILKKKLSPNGWNIQLDLI